jgi:hypothetical protein
MVIDDAMDVITNGQWHPLPVELEQIGAGIAALCGVWAQNADFKLYNCEEALKVDSMIQEVYKSPVPKSIDGCAGAILGSRENGGEFQALPDTGRRGSLGTTDRRETVFDRAGGCPSPGMSTRTEALVGVSGIGQE